MTEPGVHSRLCRAAAIVAVAAVAFAPSRSQAQVLNFRHYTALEGLPQVQVRALYQDSRGFFWFGTYGGLTRYDGSGYRTYTTDDGLNSNTIVAIAEDRTGRLLVGTQLGVCTLEDGSIRCIDSLASVRIRDVLPGLDGSLWVATETGVMYSQSERSVFRISEGLPAPHVNRLARDRQGRIWAATTAGLAVYKGARFVEIAPEIFGGHEVRAVLVTPKGLVVVAQHGVFLGDSAGFVRLPIAMAEANWRPQDVAVDAAGTLWIATRAGVIRYDTAGEVKVLSRPNGLLSDLVNRVAVDREGNLWFGTEAGASKLVPGPFVHLTEAEGLPHGFVRALAKDRSGRLWAGTRRGLAVLSGDRFDEVIPKISIPDERIFALAPLPNGGMLVGTRRGLLEVGTTADRLYGIGDGLPHEAVSSFATDADGRVWIGTRRGVATWQNGKITRLADPVLAEASALTMVRDGAGRLWIGGESGGVVIHDGKSSRVIGEQQGMSTQEVWSIARDSAGRMWVGTNGDGAYVYDEHTAQLVRRVTTRDGLVNNFVWQVLTDARGHVWLYTSHGLDRVVGEKIVHYGRGDGLIDLEGSVNAALETPDGKLWFGSGTGLVRYTHELDMLPRTAPPIYIEELTADGDPVNAAQPQVPAGTDVLEIRFAAPSFRDESSIRFRHRLHGVTERWTEAAEPTIRYAGLAPGRYDFEVVAIDDTGLSSRTTARISFTVLPLYWQTWWFRGLCLLALAAIAIAGARFRTRRLLADRSRLERLVAEHTVALTDQNRQLEREIGDRQAAEKALRKSEQRLRDIVEHSTNLFFAHGVDHVLTYVSPQAEKFLNCAPEEACREWTTFVTDHPANAAGRAATQRAIDTGEKQPPYQIELKGKQGRKIWVEVNEAPVVRDGRTVAIVGSLTDVTEAKQAAEDRERLEHQLRQAQRMEAVGRLAGGVAHDFNNLLTAVVGNTELALQTLGQDHPVSGDLLEVRRAADRAASLVTQLLAFTRQQIVKPTTLDLNAVVNDSARMLRRLIGEDIELQLGLAAEPLAIQADLSQLEQVLINLAVNARDAMPSGGKLFISTATAQLQSPLPEEGGEQIPAGSYVVLTVTDSGHGMDVETRSRAFEPFFTTKEVGKGTGLGLATVYGVVKQSDGHIRLDSEPGKGAQFRVYWPPATAPAAASQAPAAPAPAEPCKTERIVLVVEDENGVRDFVCRTLRRYGYRILEAEDGPTALAIAEKHDEPIHLLLSDMIMPGMTGKAVADWITAHRLETRVLFMSGYTRDALGERGIIAPGTQLLQKPFTPLDLARRVEQMLA